MAKPFLTWPDPLTRDQPGPRPVDRVTLKCLVCENSQKRKEDALTLAGIVVEVCSWG